ncbi:hypothetical protein BOW53_08765 [Solemya pervernicosa gill symbiont]|uniref:GGDEF domain-containing protein n=2 Tax=Gammaproteobacteria incertae sedis TaxID=118884 RepID=A0A1T2L535_9GAMM|nr:diguanylate cyclase [Candidatus Reidiella endopervernicosa]OOZ40181.1 hypothetical protein BOW53_08765 [Solemya pervernicosa gill symbiont]
MKESHFNFSSRQIASAFITIIIILVGTSSLSLYQTHRVSKELNRVVTVSDVQIEIVNKFLKLAHERSLTLQSMLLTRDPFELDDHQMRASAAASNYLRLRDVLLKMELSTDERALIREQDKQTINTGIKQSRVIRLAVDGQFDLARGLLYDEAIPSQAKAMGFMQQFIDLKQAKKRATIRETKQIIDRTTDTILVLVLLGVIISIAIAYIVTTRLKHEINFRNQFESELEQRVEERTEALTFIASHDTLTALPNRAVFTEQLANSVKHADRNGQLMALFFMDLDGFKAINDLHGHDIGDKVLIEVCRRFKETLREEDVVARIGGDEFTVIINELEQKGDALSVAQKLITQINTPMRFDAIECRVGISIGISFFPNNVLSPDALLTEADDAMYAAKRSGKNRYSVATSIV